MVLSVKPQRLDKVLAGLKGAIRSDALALSIVAGASWIKSVMGWDMDVVVRSMPNTPAQLVRDHRLDFFVVGHEQQRDWRARSWALWGKDLPGRGKLPGYGDRRLRHRAAYVFLFMEAMVDAGVHLVFPRRIAEDWYRKLCAARWLLSDSTRITSTWRACATRSHPWRTSAAALYYLEKAVSALPSRGQSGRPMSARRTGKNR